MQLVNMAREKMDPEEAKRRIKDCQRRYWETHKDEILEKQRAARKADPEAYRARRRAAYRAAMDRLVEAGFSPIRPGRKRMYTPEEALEVAKRQRKESYLRRQERLAASRTLLALDRPEAE